MNMQVDMRASACMNMQVDMRAPDCMNMHVDMPVLVVDDLTSARCTGCARVVQLQLSALPIHAAKSRMA